MASALSVREHVRVPAFQAGRLVMKPGVADLVESGEINPLPYLRRHLTCDWGDVSDTDRTRNNRAVRDETRLFSSYAVSKDLKLWIITEADRSATTMLLPSEY